MTSLQTAQRVRVVGALMMFAFLAFMWGQPALSTYIVTSDSMEPLAGRGDAVVVVGQSEYGVGDVVTFRSHQGLTTHRIVAEDDGMFTTKGDANDTLDPRLVSGAQIEGRVATTLPFGGFVMAYLQQPTGALTLLAAAAILFLGWSLTDAVATTFGGPRVART